METAVDSLRAVVEDAARVALESDVDMNFAWAIAEKMRAQDFTLELSVHGNFWSCEWSDGHAYGSCETTKSAAHAVLLAANDALAGSMSTMTRRNRA